MKHLEVVKIYRFQTRENFEKKYHIVAPKSLKTVLSIRVEKIEDSASVIVRSCFEIGTVIY